MLCKQCHFNMSNEANFCPGCGKKMTDEERQYHSLSKPSAIWLKILLGTLLTGLGLVILTILFSNDITDVVSDQLKLMKDNKLTEAYYKYTSKSFQEAAPLERFREFIKNYPELIHNKSIRFIDRQADHDVGTLHALILTEKNKEIPVRYRLVKENETWKIDGIKLEENRPSPSQDINALKDSLSLEPFESILKDQMERIRLKDFKKAYDDYTSKDFKHATSSKEFEEFIRDNQSFSNNQSIEFLNLSFNNNIATLAGKLTSKEGIVYSVEYDLVQEEDGWKIFHVEVLDQNQQSGLPSNLTFTKFILGSELDPSSLVRSPKHVFKPNSDDIYLNLHVGNANANTEIQVLFEHVDSHSTIEPVSTRISEAGDAVLTFVFSPPQSGWPQGKYRLLATSSTGESASFDFTVEE